MTPSSPAYEPVLSRRQRQILDILLKVGQADVQAILDRLPDPPSYSAVRATLDNMVDDGVLTFEKQSRRHVYAPAQTRNQAARGAAKRLLATFFGGSVSEAVAGMIDAKDRKIPPEELERLEGLIADLRRRQKKGDA